MGVLTYKTARIPVNFSKGNTMASRHHGGGPELLSRLCAYRNSYRSDNKFKRLGLVCAEDGRD